MHLIKTVKCLKLWNVGLLKKIFLRSVEETTNINLDFISLLIWTQSFRLSTSFYYEKN